MSLVTLGSSVVPDHPLLRMHPEDNVVIARTSLPADAVVHFEGREIRIQQAIGAGHKVAAADIEAGATVLKYGEDIGKARYPIRPGELVHVHNLQFELGLREFRLRHPPH